MATDNSNSSYTRNDQQQKVVRSVISTPKNIFVAGQKTVGALTNRGSMQLFNPVGSGKNLIVTYCCAKGNSSILTAYSNTTELSNDVTAGAIMSLNIGGAASIAQMYWDDLASGAIPNIVDQGDAVFGQLNSDVTIESVIGTTIPQGYGLVIENTENNNSFHTTFQFVEEEL